MKYYLDTCIWIDYFENRSDRFRPLGEWALNFVKRVVFDNGKIVISDIVYDEFTKFHAEEDFYKLTTLIPKRNMFSVIHSVEQASEALFISRKLRLHPTDILHAILARDNNADLISRDKHFHKLQEIVSVFKPEELL